MKWFKLHPSFLHDESSELSNNSNYEELHQARNNLFISHGNILVRINGLKKYPILILYTDATPFQTPIIFPVNHEIKPDEVDKISSYDFESAISEIRKHVKYFYEYRHQNDSGALCILEREALDVQSEFVGISSILKRVKDWFSGHTTLKFPMDSEEISYEAHFNNVSQDTSFFYSDQFLNPEYPEGDFLAILYKIIPKRFNSSCDRRIFHGIFLNGITLNKITDNPIVDLSPYSIHSEIQTSIDLYTKKGLVKDISEKKEIIFSSWYHVDKEPPPFKEFHDLVQIIGNGDLNIGFKRIFNQNSNNFGIAPKSFSIAIRFQNRKGGYEFQLFNIFEKSNPPVIILYSDAFDKFQSIMNRYEHVEVVKSELLTAEIFHQRNSDRAPYQILKNTSINILGVGALGSEISDCLGKAGVGNLSLHDNQILSIQNAVRHLAGIEFTGISKVEAVHTIIYNHNPFINIQTNTRNLFQLNFDDILTKSFCISTVADDNLEGFLNQQLIKANIVCFYSRALRGGTTARIFRVIPGKDACFNCLSLYRTEGKQFIDIPEDPNYPTLRNECNNPIRPASASDIKLIASFTSQKVLEYVKNPDSNINQWILSFDEKLKNSTVLCSEITEQTLIPHSDCIYCNRLSSKRVTINKDALLYMQSIVTASPKTETGGVLVGWKDELGNIHISDASGPGPRSIQMSTRFLRDTEFCQQFINDHFISSKKVKAYVGEWHSHPSLNNTPSNVDIESLTEISLNANYLTDCPVMLIFTNTGIPACTIHSGDGAFYSSPLIPI